MRTQRIKQILTECMWAILCSFGTHPWEYDFKKVKLEANKRIHYATLRTRECPKCSRKQARTALPLCNGMDVHNHWLDI